MTDLLPEILHHPVNVDVLPSSGLKIEFSPDEEQKKAITSITGIVSLDQLEAELVFRRWRKKGVSVKGRLHAKITQECVITLEPVHSEITEKIDRIFLPEGSSLLKPELNREGEMILDPEDDDIPDAFGGNTLYAWEIILEQLQLAIDPFPRLEGAELDTFADHEEKGNHEPAKSPFAVLKGLQNEDKG